MTWQEAPKVRLFEIRQFSDMDYSWVLRCTMLCEDALLLLFSAGFEYNQHLAG